MDTTDYVRFEAAREKRRHKLEAWLLRNPNSAASEPVYTRRRRTSEGVSLVRMRSLRDRTSGELFPIPEPQILEENALAS